jgi:hypothetical protein
MGGLFYFLAGMGVGFAIDLVWDVITVTRRKP